MTKTFEWSGLRSILIEAPLNQIVLHLLLTEDEKRAGLVSARQRKTRQATRPPWAIAIS